MSYDFVIVGSGLFGAVFAHEARRANKRVLVLEKRDHIGGNLYCEQRDGIDIHRYGAHIFHTSIRRVWDYVNQFTAFNHFRNSPIAIYRDRLFNLPFNMHTFHQMWPDVVTPEDARRRIEQQRKELSGPISNLEEQAIALVGRDIYETLVKGYTEKQWNRSCRELPPSIITRIPVRYRYDNNYFDDPWQGIPLIGYNGLIGSLLEGVEVVTNTDFNKNRQRYRKLGRTIVHTGALDSLFDCSLGSLAYRSVRFEHRRVATGNHQGVAVVNYTEREVPHTRSIEHAHFTFTEGEVSWVSLEYPVDYRETNEPFYPVRDAQNLALHAAYRRMAGDEHDLLTGGRLAEYAYYDMDKTIASALTLCDAVFS